jgi:DNA polymerase-3 subunit delta
LKINANQLTAHLQKTVASCYLVTGDEHLLVAEALDAIRAAAREKGFSARDVHVATAGFDWALLRDSGANLSLFAERRIVELRLPTGKPGRAGAQAIVDFVALTGPDLLFVVSGPKLDRSGQSAKWAKTLEASGVSVPIWPVEQRELPGWIAARMRRAGLKPDREEVALIADRVEGNLLAAAQEIEKLRLLLDDGEVSAGDVSSAVADSSRFDVFKLADAALAGDTKRALRILSGLAAEGVEPVMIIWALTRDLRTLASLADAVAAGGDLGRAMQKTGVWRNRQALVRSCVSRHQRRDFYRLLRLASRADQAAKGQLREDPWQVLTDIVLGIALAGRKAA